jgi:hypothetical protein
MDTTTTTNDPTSSWAPWIQNTLSTIIGAAALKQFAPNGMQSYQTYQLDAYGNVIASGQASSQPVYQQQQGNTLLLIGLVVAVAMLVKA